jgi:uncharacterized damage-inducible protein DinB
MSASIVDLARRFRFNEGLLQLVGEGLTDDEWKRRPSDVGGNPALWILGHVAMVRRKALQRLGLKMDPAAWAEHFVPNRAPGDSSAWPSAAELTGDFRRSGEALAARCAELGADELAEEWGKTFPDGSTTVEGGLHFLYFHETYHLGQIGLIRRLCGKPGFK